MSKSHVVKLTIKNETGYEMTNPIPWFDSGRVADGWSIPTVIRSGEVHIVEMYEKDWSTAGCSGSINYDIGDGVITIAFSNPSVGSNKLGCGPATKRIWDDMDDHGYKPFTEEFQVGSLKIKTMESCTDGNVNQANVRLLLMANNSVNGNGVTK
jgi:hypothetical protein